MKSAMKWFAGAVLGGLVLGALIAGSFTPISHSAQRSSWAITIQTNPTIFSCNGKSVPVPAANSCDSAIKAAQLVFSSIIGCADLCPNGVIAPEPPTCTVNNFTLPNGTPGQNFRVSIPYGCGPGRGATRPECDEAAVMQGSHPVFPAGATDLEAPVDVDEDRGLLSTLYPKLNTTTDEFYPLPCEPSIGGELPPDEPPSQDELDAEDYLNKFDTGKAGVIANDLKLSPMLPPSQLSTFKIGDCFIVTGRPATRRQVPCDSPLLLQKGQPFEGRDIIYVHGLATKHLQDKLINPLPSAHPVHKLWPQDASEFLDTGKYYRTYAENYWRDHIRENLFDPDNPSSGIAGWQWTAADEDPIYKPKSNRYMLVAWSSTQTIEFAQHALLKQIQLAITTNKNVVTPPTYPSTHVRPFCANGCIIISHSTGGLITSSAMGLAKTGFFGAGGKQISSNIRAHVAFEPALSGSRLASVGIAIGTGVTPAVSAANILCLILDELYGTTNTCNADTSFVTTSILRDLVPTVAQLVWGPIVNISPVPTVTVAGGHPIGNFYSTTKIFLPGLDDGVVSMNSACGNPNPVSPGVIAPSGSTVTSLVKAFDYSNNPGRLIRASKNWLSHKNFLKAPSPLPKYLAGACTPYRSPTGMVMPVENAYVGPPWDARNRYQNHFSFLQGVIDHSYDGGTDDKNKWPSELQLGPKVIRVYKPFLGATNSEETSAITNAAIYAPIDGNGTRLVHPSFAAMREVVRGKKVSFRLFGKRRTWWIWKRTYHLLDKWGAKQSSHYVYEFVGRR